MKIETRKGEPFLLLNDAVSNIVLFSCQTNLAVMGSMETIFVDGTLSSYPNFLTQLFTLNGVENGNYVQFCFALLPSKKTVIYNRFLELLLSVCPLLAPRSVIMDFECTIHTAVILA